MKGHSLEVFGVAFSPNGALLASASLDRTVKLWDEKNGREVRTLMGHENPVYRVTFSPDGTRLVSTSVDGTMKVWDASSGLEIRTIRGHTRAITGVVFSPDGTRLASASSDDHTVKLWNTTSEQEARLLIQQSPHAGLAFSPDGTWLASKCRGDGATRILDATTGRVILTLKDPSGQIHGQAFHPNGKLIATTGRTVKIWNAQTGALLQTLPIQTNDANQGVAFSPDGTRLACAYEDQDHSVRVWDLTTGQEAFPTLTGHTHAVLSVAFSPDGRQIASGSFDNTVKIWDAWTGKETLTLRGHTFHVWEVAYSSDGARLASASQDQTVKIWDARTGKEIVTCKGHASKVQSVAFSAGDSRIASAGSDGTVKIWDARTGQEILSLKGEGGEYAKVAFSPDGTRLALINERMLKLWDARPLTPDAAAEREAIGLLDHLFSKPLCKADIERYLQNSPPIRPEAQKLALIFVDRYQEATDPKQYHDAAWPVLRHPYANLFQYRFALQQAETACRLAPEEAKYRTTLGAAQYRAGKCKEAIGTLEKAEQGNKESPAHLAFLTMTYHQLGMKDEAKAMLTRWREVMKQERWANDADAQAFLKEAEDTLQQKPASDVTKDAKSSEK